MKSKYFKIHELVPKNLFGNIHEDVLWRIVPFEIIITIDTLKETFSNGTMTINNYIWGGNREWSGLRSRDSSYFSETSQHCLFNAIDAVFSDYTAEYIRNYIIANQDKFPHIKRLEDKVTWLHFDTKKTGKKEIVIFNP